MSRTTRALALLTAALAAAATALPGAAVADPVTPTITSAGASFGLQLGGSIYGRVQLTSSVPPTGTLTFALHGPDDPTCALPPERTETVEVAGDGFYRVDATPLHAGSYVWRVAYGGDGGNLPVTAACGVGGTATVLRAPWWMTLAAPSTGVVGAPLEATATLGAGECPPLARARVIGRGWGCFAGPRANGTALAAAAPGAIGFAVYGPDDASCAREPVFEAGVPVTGAVGGVRRSAPFVPAEPGAYRWTAAYGGDADNATASVDCPDAALTTVARATPTVTVTATAGGAVVGDATAGATSGGAVVGDALGATAVVSGGFEPSGELSFALHGPGDERCTEAPVHTAVVAVAGDGSYAAPPFVATALGGYRWTVAYAGDRRNAPAASGCDAAGAAITLTERPAASDPPPSSPPSPEPKPEPPVEPRPAVRPAVERLALAARCVRPRAAGAAVTVRLLLRTATSGPLRVRVERAVGTAGRATCPPAGGRGRFDGRYRTVANRRVDGRAAAAHASAPAARRSARAVQAAGGAASAALPRTVALRLRLAPALYRITVTAGGGSTPRRRFLRVLAPRARR